MTVATISAPQLRSLFEARWQADKDALALGLHVAHPCQAPDEVELRWAIAIPREPEEPAWDGPNPARF